MLIRALIVAQVAWIAVLGATTRRALASTPIHDWAEAVAYSTFWPLFLAFPLGVVFALRRTPLPPWKRDAVIFLEAVLFGVAMLAILPAVQ